MQKRTMDSKQILLVQASLFDPTKVKVWPVINTVFERVVQLRLLRPLIEKVLPIVAGKNDMNEVEAMLVKAVTKLYPDPMSVNIDVGKLISKGIELARKKIGGRRTRRLEGSEEGGSWISEEGMFDLGHIPPSDRLDGGFEGSGKACGWKCGTFKSDGTFGPAPDKPDYAMPSKNMTNLTCATVNAGLPFNCSNETNAIDANPTNITCLSQLKCTSTECCTVVATTTILTSTLIIIIVCSSVVFIGIIIAVVVVVKKGITSKKKELTKVTPANVKSNTKKTKNKNKKKTKSKNKMENKKTVVLSAKQKGSVASWEAPGETSKRETLKFLDT